MISLEELKSDLQDTIDVRNVSDNATSSMSLYSIYLEMLSGSGQIMDDNLSEINSIHDGIHLAAFARDLERGVINVFTTEYSSALEIEKLYQKDLEKNFAAIRKLLFNSLWLERNELDDGDPTIDLIEDLQLRNQKFSRVIIWNLTNKLYSSRSEAGLNLKEQGFEVIYNCFDLNYYRSVLTDNKLSEISISTDLKAIKVLETTSYTSYLFSISGMELCNYYDRYGKRLLESNVRTFLSLRGNTNKGIYNTIHLDDQRPFFFAYNNGLTATCSDIKYEGGSIKELTDLQIVNGGQTMSTIYKAWRDGKRMTDIHVPVKLSVIHDIENKSLFVSRISRYANTQNKVSNSDFFSNSYYHRAVKEMSSKIRVGAKGKISKEKWFYERVRGEYLNDQMFLSASEKKRFQLEYPKSHVFDKIAIAKAYLSVNQQPHHVSKGAQLCFAQFASRVSDLYDEDKNIFTEHEYKTLIAQVILFRSLEKVVSNTAWYSGGYRAQTVAYTIASFVRLLAKEKLTIDWNEIWANQMVHPAILDELDTLGAKVHEILISPPPGNTNIGTYSKKEACWKRIQESPISTNVNLTGVISFEELIVQNKESRKGRAELKGINAQIAVLDLAKGKVPNKLLEFYNSSQAPGIRDKDRAILRSWKDGRIGYPSEAQANIIYDLVRLAEKNGLEI